MQTRRAIALAGLAIAVATWLSIPLAAQKKGGKQSDTEIRTSFRDDPADAVFSDGLPYETDSDQRTRNVLFANNEGNYSLETLTGTKGSAVRCVNLNLSNVVATAPGETVPLGACLTAGMITRSYFFDGKDDLRAMSYGQGQQVAKRFVINWTVGKVNYHLRFKGDPVDLGSGVHKLGNVVFTCTGADEQGCNAWSAEPMSCEDIAQTGTPFNSFTNCTANALAVIDRDGPGGSTLTPVAVVEMPFAMTFVRR
jgi:hypothetical protein